MSSYSIKPPDMSRNIALAGQTVSTRGMNVTYDERGYAVKAVNYNHRFFAETSKSICAPSKEAVLAGDSRIGYDGPDEDRKHFSDSQFARAVELRRQVAEGKLSEREANAQIEEIRRLYGYSFGASGAQYAAITLPAEQPAEVARAQEAQSPFTAQATSVQSAAPENAESEIRHLREDCQTQLDEQQQYQSMLHELKELRVQDMIRVSGKGMTSDALLELLGEDEND